MSPQAASTIVAMSHLKMMIWAVGFWLRVEREEGRGGEDKECRAVLIPYMPIEPVVVLFRLKLMRMLCGSLRVSYLLLGWEQPYHFRDGGRGEALSNSWHLKPHGGSLFSFWLPAFRLSCERGLLLWAKDPKLLAGGGVNFS